MLPVVTKMSRAGDPLTMKESTKSRSFVKTTRESSRDLCIHQELHAASGSIRFTRLSPQPKESLEA